MSEQDHPIPPEPAGTQPKVDVSSLLPARIERDPDAHEPLADLLPERVEHDAPVVAGPPAEPPHAAKFQFILGALIAIGVALGVALMVVVVVEG